MCDDSSHIVFKRITRLLNFVATLGHGPPKAGWSKFNLLCVMFAIIGVLFKHNLQGLFNEREGCRSSTLTSLSFHIFNLVTWWITCRQYIGTSLMQKVRK